MREIICFFTAVVLFIVVVYFAYLYVQYKVHRRKKLNNENATET